MPAIPKISNRPLVVAVPSKNGASQYLAERLRSDQVEIGAGVVSTELVEVEGATMADAAKLVAGIKYLVRGWIPFGMVTGLVAEPGVGKSAFALWMARTIMTGCSWFTDTRGPEPGCVLWCATENDMAITIDRMKKWSIPMGRLILPFPDPLKTVNLTDDNHLQRIDALINKHRTKAVIIDSLRGGHSSDENNSQVGRVLQNLSEIAE